MKDYLIKNRGVELSNKEISAYFDKFMTPSMDSNTESFFSDFNGGEFVDNVKLHFREREIDLKGILRLEPGHLYDVSNCISSLSDYEFDEMMVPIMYTFSSDFVVYDPIKVGIYYWEHETGDIALITKNFEDLFSHCSKEKKLSAFEEFCLDGRLKDSHMHEFDIPEKLLCEEASRYGNLPLVKDGYEAGLPLGKSLQFAAMNGEEQVIDYLLSIGCDLNRLDENGKTIRDWVFWNPEYDSLIAERGGVYEKNND